MGEDIASLYIQKRHSLIITKTKHEFEFSVLTTLKKFSQQLHNGMFG